MIETVFVFPVLFYGIKRRRSYSDDVFSFPWISQIHAVKDTIFGLDFSTSHYSTLVEENGRLQSIPISTLHFLIPLQNTASGDLWVI
jgi:hypothetical protein